MGNNITLITEPFVHPYFSANIFHVKGRDKDLVVDFGMGILPLVPALELEPGKPVIAVATHIHADHVGGFHEFPVRLGHPAEAREFAGMLEHETLVSVFRTLKDPVRKSPIHGWNIQDYGISEAPLTLAVEEGYVIELGDRSFKVLHMPGHTHGSICLLDESSQEIFTGDVIYKGGLVDNLDCSNRDLYKLTMARLRDMNIRFAYGGHGGVMTGEEVKEIATAYIEGNSKEAKLD
nr:MBL fold metallo-hydrolase [Pseudomonas sp. CG7]